MSVCLCLNANIILYKLLEWDVQNFSDEKGPTGVVNRSKPKQNSHAHQSAGLFASIVFASERI